jgi:hypothetical protein
VIFFEKRSKINSLKSNFFLFENCFSFKKRKKMSVVKNELKRAGKIVTTQATEDGIILIYKT